MVKYAANLHEPNIVGSHFFRKIVESLDRCKLERVEINMYVSLFTGIRLFVFVCLGLSVSIYLSVCLSLSLYCLGFYLSIYGDDLSIYLLINISVIKWLPASFPITRSNKLFNGKMTCNLLSPAAGSSGPTLNLYIFESVAEELLEGVAPIEAFGAAVVHKEQGIGLGSRSTRNHGNNKYTDRMANFGELRLRVVSDYQLTTSVCKALERADMHSISLALAISLEVLPYHHGQILKAQSSSCHACYDNCAEQTHLALSAN